MGEPPFETGRQPAGGKVSGDNSLIWRLAPGNHQGTSSGACQVRKFLTLASGWPSRQLCLASEYTKASAHTVISAARHGATAVGLTFKHPLSVVLYAVMLRSVVGLPVQRRLCAFFWCLSAVIQITNPARLQKQPGDDEQLHTLSPMMKCNGTADLGWRNGRCCAHCGHATAVLYPVSS